jgi:hypothetical protein
MHVSMGGVRCTLGNFLVFLISGNQLRFLSPNDENITLAAQVEPHGNG